MTKKKAEDCTQKKPYTLEDNKRATNVQNGLVFSFSFSFLLLRKGLILRESNGGKSVQKSEKV